MSIFMLPKALCSKINSLMQKFWWGASSIPWLSWSKMGASKAKVLWDFGISLVLTRPFLPSNVDVYGTR
jgi:hypothetical protein